MKTKLLFSLFALVALASGAQDDYHARVTHFNTDKYAVALQGYDPVSYFEGRPVKGMSSIFTFYKGIRYEFVSKAHLLVFKSDPARYEPAYGGWCAYAMGKNGEKVEVDPLSYKIVNNRLYLFYRSILNNTLEKWNQDEAGLKSRADKNWKVIFH